MASIPGFPTSLTNDWVGCLTVLGNLFIFRCRRCRPLVVAMGTAGETACPTLLDQSFGEVGGAGGFACRWKLISIAHPNPENGGKGWYPCGGNHGCRQA